MAYFVQTLTLVWLSATVLGAAEFSHSVHLKQKLACTACHVAAASSKRAEDNLLPRQEACGRCHAAGSVTARTTPSPRFVAKFNHSVHAKMLNCQGCHRLAEGAANPGFAAMQFCIGCHNKIEPPYSCVKCHLETQQLRPPSHTADFIDVHSSGKLNLRVNGASCAVCHGRNFTCQGCH